MIPVWNIQIHSGAIEHESPEQFHQYILRIEGDAELIVRRRRKKRSLNQNSYYWGVVIDILSRHFGYAPEEMHEALLVEYAEYRRGARKKGAPPIIVDRSSEMTTAEFEEFTSWVRRWSMYEYQVNIPEPNEVEL